MVLNSVILNALSNKSGYDVTTPAGCTNLHLDMLETIKEAPSVNTLKRLTGVLPYKGKSTRYTLDLIASYLEKMTWPQLKKKYLAEADQSIDFRTLPEGAHIDISLGSGQSISLCHLSHGKYKVINSCHDLYIAGRNIQL